jgi:hypothetical protein
MGTAPMDTQEISAQEALAMGTAPMQEMPAQEAPAMGTAPMEAPRTIGMAPMPE